MFVKNPDYFHTFVTRESIVDCVTYNGEFPIARSNVIAGDSEIWIFSQLMEGIIELFQILIALVFSPPLLSEDSNSYQIISGFSFKPRGGHQ